MLCLVELHRESCAFLSRASAEISPLLCVCTSVCVVFIRDAKEISLHFEGERCRQGRYHDKVHGCFPRCVVSGRLQRLWNKYGYMVPDTKQIRYGSHLASPSPTPSTATINIHHTHHTGIHTMAPPPVRVTLAPTPTPRGMAIYNT